MSDLESSLTFDNFVVGPANRLAAAAARRAADSPGTSYNPLFVYSASGLGKSHILNAVANHAEKVHPEFQVVYQTLEGYLNELASALEAGERDGLQKRYQALDLLLLDDVQFLTGQSEAQEMLLRTLDSMSGGGKQIVLASDRPPAEINGLDARLLSRFSAGLIVDIGPPEYETRMAIVRKKVKNRGADLSPEVCEAVARFPFKNVRELQGGLNRILAIQDLEEREVSPEEASQILGGGGRAEVGDDGADDFFQEISDDVAATVQEQEAPWRKLLRETIQDAEERGFSPSRLRRLSEGDEEPDDVESLVEEFRAALDRLEEIKDELEALGNPWPEAALSVLQDPERLEEAEALLASARERVRAFPTIEEGPDLETLAGTYPSLPVKAAQRLVAAERPEYNPLFLSCPDPDRARRVLAAAGRSFLTENPEGRVALISAADFAEDFIRALSSGVAGAWRERWWTVELLLLYGVEALSETERAQDEFFHLFEALKRREARIFLAADRPPAAIQSIDDRLRSRFEGGLAVEMTAATEEVEATEAAQESAEPAATPRPAAPQPDEAPPRNEKVVPSLDELDFADDGRGGLFPSEKEEEVPDAEEPSAPEPPEAPEPDGDEESQEVEEPAPTRAQEPPETPTPEGKAGRPGGVVLDGPEMPSPADLVPTSKGDGSAKRARDKSSDGGWKPSPEKVVWEWPRLSDRLVEERD